MSLVETRILRESWEVEPELIRLDLTKAGLLRVRTMALAAGADATPFHAANAAGTFQYHYGIFGLRNEFVGDLWRVDRPDGIEVIRNDVQNLFVGFANVDVACNDEHRPIPRSKKGAGAERATQSTLFGALPTYAQIPAGSRSFYYLMVALDGAAEFSRPIVQNGEFVAFVDRIYLTNGGDLGGSERSFEDGDIADNFDPLVLRKVG